MVATVLVSAGAASVNDLFAGLWIGHEPAPPAGDGSTDYMMIGRPGPGGARMWLYYETNASGYCAGGGPLAAAGKGRSEDNVLAVTITWTRCANGSPGAIATPFDVTVTAAGDGLDFFGVPFTRLGSG
jgi:hypothetical protein